VGMPGETIAIHRGKLFVLSPEGAKKAGLQYSDHEDAAGDAEKRAMLWRPEFMHQDDKKALELFDKGEFTILRKNAGQVKAMMRLVHDNDFQPTDLVGEESKRWRPAEKSAWKESGQTGFAHSAEGDDLTWLRYRHVLRDSDGKPSLITDF